MKPNKNNFCGGAYADWLEVSLLAACNAHCAWCIDRDAWHPKKGVSWKMLVRAILLHGATNIMLLGGEPTLHPNLKEIVKALDSNGKKVYLTTNGTLLNEGFAENSLSDLTGLNISIHDYRLHQNNNIIGREGPNKSNLMAAIDVLHEKGVSVRLNCNLIKGHIDDVDALLTYLRFAQSLGVKNVRFAELKDCAGDFIDLAEMLDYKYGLTRDPFTLGCVREAVINGINVNFRQMCGLQTPKRPRPKNPEQVTKQVLYYDGKIYNGWQTKEQHMTNKEKVDDILRKLMLKQLSVPQASKALKALVKDNRVPPAGEGDHHDGYGCHY